MRKKNLNSCLCLRLSKLKTKKNIILTDNAIDNAAQRVAWDQMLLKVKFIVEKQKNFHK
jgi:hypothetical protein